MEIKVMTNILDKNDRIALENRERLSKHGIFALNLLGSPGSGKTSLLEKTIARLGSDLRLAVIEGDLFTSKDADRIARQGVPVVQINTGGGCHLDAQMVQQALTELDLNAIDVLIIENVGNLVCPAEFALGECCKVVVLSVTEGDDKPLKYPLVFKESRAAILNKVDILEHTGFDMVSATHDLRSISPTLTLLPVSCRTGEGLDAWYGWLREQVDACRKAANEKPHEPVDLTKMLQEIEQVRELLNNLVANKMGNTSDPEVAGVSAHLDMLIVQCEKLKSNLKCCRMSQLDV